MIVPKVTSISPRLHQASIVQRLYAVSKQKLKADEAHPFGVFPKIRSKSAWIGAAVAETVCVIPRVVIGFDGYQGSHKLPTSCSGIWGLTNYIGRKLCEYTGASVGAMGGMLTSPIGLAAGVSFAEWSIYASAMGALLGSALALLPIEASEMTRRACAAVLGVGIGFTSDALGAVGALIGVVAGFAVHPQRQVELTSPLLCATAYGLRGYVLSRRNDFPAALKCFDRAIELDPDSAYYHAVRGQVLYHQNDLAGALQSFDRAVEREPSNLDYRADHQWLMRKQAAASQADPCLAFAT